MDWKRKVLISGAALALAALVTLGLGNPPVASAAPTGIGTCTTIASAGSYVITDNLIASGDHCLVIGADDVTIDLDGFRIMGDGTAGKSGITDNGILRRSIAVRNGTIQGFAHRGIDLASSDQIKVEEMRVHTNGGGGIFGRTLGIVKDCVVTANGSDGIVMGEAVLTGNTVTHNAGSGIGGGTESTLTNNTASFNSGRGIRLLIAPLDKCCNTLTSNTASHNGGHGIFASSCCNTFTSNTAGRNGGDGMVVQSASTLTGNTASGNTGTGIAVTCPSNLNGNTAVFNSVTDISTAGPGCRRVNNLPVP
jgi:parallel beta-helix repeat protein